MRTAFVTGATGFIGLNLVEQLVSSGWEVIAFHRPGSRLDELHSFPVRLKEGSLLDPASLRAAIPENADALFHLAGNTSLWKRERETQTRDNVDATRCVVDAAISRGVRKFVYTSSAAAWGLHQTCLTEDSESRAMRSGIHYMKTKWLAEEEVRRGVSEGLDATIVNPAHVMGPRDRHNWSRMIRMTSEGTLPGIPPGGGSFAHVADIAKAHIAAAERGRTGANYLLGGVDATFVEMVETIQRVLGRSNRIRRMPAFVLLGYAHMATLVAELRGLQPEVTPDSARLVCHHEVCDSSRAIRELGFSTSTLEEMIRDCVGWMQVSGQLLPPTEKK